MSRDERRPAERRALLRKAKSDVAANGRRTSDKRKNITRPELEELAKAGSQKENDSGVAEK